MSLEHYDNKKYAQHCYPNTTIETSLKDQLFKFQNLEYENMQLEVGIFTYVIHYMIILDILMRNQHYFCTLISF